MIDGHQVIVYEYSEYYLTGVDEPLLSILGLPPKVLPALIVVKSERLQVLAGL